MFHFNDTFIKPSPDIVGNVAQEVLERSDARWGMQELTQSVTAGKNYLSYCIDSRHQMLLEITVCVHVLCLGA